jgi:hypothetical protein
MECKQRLSAVSFCEPRDSIRFLHNLAALLSTDYQTSNSRIGYFGYLKLDRNQWDWGFILHRSLSQVRRKQLEFQNKRHSCCCSGWFTSWKIIHMVR